MAKFSFGLLSRSTGKQDHPQMQFGSGVESTRVWSSEAISVIVIDYMNILRRNRKAKHGDEVISVNKLMCTSYFMHV